MKQPHLKKTPTDSTLRGIDRCRYLLENADRTKKMEIFRWVKGMLLGVVCVIAFRLFAEGLGWEAASITAAYLGVALMGVGAILAIIGNIRDRKSSTPSTLTPGGGKCGKRY